MKIQSLHIYPIKSLGGISLPYAEVLERGLAFDRRWMLVDANGVFITQRKYPSLALISVELSSNHLLVHSNRGASLQVPLNPEGEQIEVTVWDDTVNAIEVSTEVSKWFSSQLKQAVKLVYMPDDSQRMIDPKYAKNEESVSFADGYPILITNTASLEDLNKKLESKISMERFRPNMVVNGQVAFEEDNWYNLAIGNTKLEVVKRCARCVMVNINPENAIKETKVLQALSTYRKKNNKVYFGVNALVQEMGEVKVGDDVVFVG